MILKKADATGQSSTTDEVRAHLGTDPKRYKSKRSIVMSFLALCFVCMLLNFAQKTILKLNENINLHGNVGIISSAILSGSTLISALLLPNLMIHVLGYWWILFMTALTTLLYASATLIENSPWINFAASALTGLMNAPLDTVKGAFVTELSMNYEDVTEQSSDSVLPRFFGIFNGIYQFSKYTYSTSICP